MRITYGVLQEFAEVSSQDEFDTFLSGHERNLRERWLAEYRKELAYGPGRKLLNLLFKCVLRCTDVPAKKRPCVIPFLHVPIDEYLLTAIRHCADSDEFGERFTIPQRASMGWIESSEHYNKVQALVRQIAARACVAPICVDLLAWDESHRG